MKEPATLPFLARPGYRRRRLIEAIRLLPYLGVLAVVLPLLWATGAGAEQAQTSSGWIYIFVAWLTLIAITAAASAAFARAGDEGADGDAPPEGSDAQ